MSDVSRETEARLSDFAALLRKWNPSINLVAPSTLAQLERRHIGDSRQLAGLADLQTGSWADLGSGGGFPGLVAAIYYADRPVTFHLVESDQRKATFLRNACRELDLYNITVHTARIESLISLRASIVSARALAPLTTLMSYVDRHLETGGVAWLMKGRNWQAELDQAQKTWQFDVKAHPSLTDPDAAILEVTGINHV